MLNIPPSFRRYVRGDFVFKGWVSVSSSPDLKTFTQQRVGKSDLDLCLSHSYSAEFSALNTLGGP